MRVMYVLACEAWWEVTSKGIIKHVLGMNVGGLVKNDYQVVIGVWLGLVEMKDSFNVCHHE